jgi:hypothetical protein
MADELRPIADRPHMPGYGIVGAEEGTGLLPWSWAEERLIRSHDYWLATAWPDGRPHVMPVWAVWFDASIWFSCSLSSRKTRNLLVDRRGVLTTDDPRNRVIVERGCRSRLRSRDAPSGPRGRERKVRDGLWHRTTGPRGERVFPLPTRLGVRPERAGLHRATHPLAFRSVERKELALPQRSCVIVRENSTVMASVSPARGTTRPTPGKPTRRQARRSRVHPMPTRRVSANGAL